MDDSTRTQIILAAIGAAGPAGDDLNQWQANVTDLAGRITVMTADTSPVAQAVAGVANAKVFPATIMSITREQSSTRGLVSLKTKPSTHHPDGIETARTERTDNNPAGLLMARRIKSLIGHKALLWVQVQEFNNGASKVRVIRHVEDLGPAQDDDTAAA